MNGDTHYVRRQDLSVQRLRPGDVYKRQAHQGVGVAAVFCCQQLDAVKGAVDNAVAVQYKKFQGETSDVFRLMGRAARQFKNIIP